LGGTEVKDAVAAGSRRGETEGGSIKRRSYFLGCETGEGLRLGGLGGGRGFGSGGFIGEIES